MENQYKAEWIVPSSDVPVVIISGNNLKNALLPDQIHLTYAEAFALRETLDKALMVADSEYDESEEAKE